MNPNWKNFLITENVVFRSDTDIVFPSLPANNGKRICPVAQLAVLTIAGRDAAKLLQGQITCNVNDISETQSSLGAMCNPKGRAIATFLLVRTADAFLMVLPVELLETVKKRLHMYILRSDVQITDSSDELCLIGMLPQPAEEELFATHQGKTIAVNFSGRDLVIAKPEQAIALWLDMVGNQGFQPGDSRQWRHFDIVTGIPWLTTETSEQFIPQMLNLDKLGGISFNKGCYTGQEIVARTHYLGKAKRAMFLAECAADVVPAPDSIILDDNADSEQGAGRVLLAETGQGPCKMLVVLQLSDTDTYNLRLNDPHQTPLNLLPFNS